MSSPDGPPERYRKLIEETFEGAVRQANSRYPEQRSVKIDWEQLDAADRGVAVSLLEDPRTTRKRLTAALRHYDAVEMEDAVIRPYNLPEDHHFRVGKQRTRHLGTAIGITGEVVEIEPVKPFAKVAAFVCRRCGDIETQAQSYGRMLYPAECVTCEKRIPDKDWLFKRAESDLVDVRELVLVRRETNLDDDPPILKIRLTGDLVERLGPGDHVTLVGRYDSGMFQKSSILTTYLDTWSIENQEEGTMMDEIPPSELKDIIEEEVEALQSEDPSDFGADRERVEDIIEEEGVRRAEVESAIEEMKDEGRVNETSGGKLLI